MTRHSNYVLVFWLPRPSHVQCSSSARNLRSQKDSSPTATERITKTVQHRLHKSQAQPLTFSTSISYSQASVTNTDPQPWRAQHPDLEDGAAATAATLDEAHTAAAIASRLSAPAAPNPQLHRWRRVHRRFRLHREKESFATLLTCLLVDSGKQPKVARSTSFKDPYSIRPLATRIQEVLRRERAAWGDKG